MYVVYKDKTDQEIFSLILGIFYPNSILWLVTQPHKLYSKQMSGCH